MAAYKEKLQNYKTEIHRRCMDTKLTKCLDLSGLKLYTIPKDVILLGHTLRHLYLHKCSLKDGFPFEIMHLPSLETLDLSQNRLTIIPDSFCVTARLLRVLDVSYNELYRLPSSMNEMIQLREFNAAHNKLIYIPSELGKLRHLEEVDLNNNDLLGLPNTLFDDAASCSIRSLNVAGNQLTELPKSLGCVKGLQSLNLSNNKLKYVPASMKQLKKLHTLHYGYNEWYALKYAKRGDNKAYGCKALFLIGVLSL